MFFVFVFSPLADMRQGIFRLSQSVRSNNFNPSDSAVCVCLALLTRGALFTVCYDYVIIAQCIEYLFELLSARQFGCLNVLWRETTTFHQSVGTLVQFCAVVVSP